MPGTEIIVALIGAGVGILSTLVTVFYGPAWKDQLDRQRQRSKRSETLLARYSEPLARAAFDLQSRLYNVARRGAQPSIDPMSTLWLFGQYLAWIEIVRREVQVLDMGDVSRTSELQQHLFDITDTLASSLNIHDPVFNVVRANQRAIGEVMVVDRQVAGKARSDSMGYATFTQRMLDPIFGVWFNDLSASINALAGGLQGHTRPIHLQRALIDLIDFLDPDRVRFPDPNERGKIPLPPGTADPVLQKRARPPGQVARFEYFVGDPWQVFDRWLRGHNFVAIDAPGGVRRVVALPRPIWQLHRWQLTISQVDQWIEVDIARSSLSGAWIATNARIPRSARIPIDELLQLFDRPPTSGTHNISR